MTPSVEALNSGALLNLLREITEGIMAKTWLAEIRWKDGHIRRSYLKVFSFDHQLGLINEITGYILAKNSGLPLPSKAGIIKLPDNMFQGSNNYLPYAFITSEVPGKSPNSMYNIDSSSTIDHLKPVVEKIKGWKYLPNCMAFDDWTANTDRHFGNVIFSGPGDLYLIDHSNLPLGVTWSADDLIDETSYENRLANLINLTDASLLPKQMQVSNAAIKHPDYYKSAYNELKQWWDLLLESDTDRRVSIERFIKNRADNGHQRICKNLHILEV